MVSLARINARVSAVLLGAVISMLMVPASAFTQTYIDPAVQNIVSSSPACGNGILEILEECDDFNTAPADGCSASCKIESASACDSGYSDQISRDGITWKFDKCYRVGSFANGDYWVKTDSTSASVKIVEITPARTGGLNGFEVNPLPQPNGKCTTDGLTGDLKKDYQGFDSRAPCYNGTLVPALPYLARANESIVKVISSETVRPNVKVAGVLTVLGSVPADNGVSIFRPPYVGSEKPLYSVTSLHTSLLPKLAPVAYTPNIVAQGKNFRKLRLDHKPGGTGLELHPSDAIPRYPPMVAIVDAEALLRLTLNDPLEAKFPLLVGFLQMGIDMYHDVLNGQVWPKGDAVQPGHPMPIAFTAMLFNDPAMISTSQTYYLKSDAGEDNYIRTNPRTGQALYGAKEGGFSQEEGYWYSVTSPDQYGKEIRDPYKYIDGGGALGGGYQLIMTPAWKGMALAFNIIPEMFNAWYDVRFFDYLDRFVNVGMWTKPDPCAPAQGFCDYGPTAGLPCTLVNEYSVCKQNNSKNPSECATGKCAPSSPVGAGTICGGRINSPTYSGVRVTDPYLGACEAKYCVPNPDFYKKTYGPNPSAPGSCILDPNLNSGATMESFTCKDGALCGRLPHMHGVWKDQYQPPYSSRFVNAMWSAYRGSSCYNGVCDGNETAASCPADCDSSIKLRFDFEDGFHSGKVTDKSGTGNTGDCDNTRQQCPDTILLTDLTKAAQFGGELCDMHGKYVAVNSSSSLNNLAKGTISLWVKYDKTPTEPYTGLISSFDRAVNGTWHLGGTPSTALPYFSVTNTSRANSPMDPLLPLGNPTPKKWYQYTVTWDGSVITAYVNGVKSGSVAQPYPALVLGDYLILGSFGHSEPRNASDNNCWMAPPDGYGCIDLCTSNCKPGVNYCPNPHPTYTFPNDGFLNGAMDDAKIYSRALSASEVSLYYSNTLPKYADPVCLNNIKQGDEKCDGTDFGGESCQTLGFAYGKLNCKDDCSAIETNFCSNVGYSCEGCTNFGSGGCSADKCHFIGTNVDGGCLFTGTGSMCQPTATVCNAIGNDCSKVSQEECGPSVCGRLSCRKWANACTSFDPMLLLHYDFEGNLSRGIIADRSGYGRNGACSGTTCPTTVSSHDTSTAGRSEGDSKNQTIELTSAAGDLTPFMQMKSGTVAFWAKYDLPDSISTVADAMSAYNGNQPGTWKVWRAEGNSTVTSFTFFDDKGVKTSVPFSDSRSTTWRHYAISWGDSNGSIKLFLDGKLVKSVPMNVVNSYKVSAFNFGTSLYTNNKPYLRFFAQHGNPNSQWWRFAGNIDDFMIFSRAMSESEISGISQTKAPVITCGDNLCSTAFGEDCKTCSKDCGSCQSRLPGAPSGLKVK